MHGQKTSNRLVEIMDISQFPGSTPEDLSTARTLFQGVEVPTGFVLMETGDIDSSMVYVESGEIEIQKDKIVLGLATAGSAVGEIALFTNKPRSASVIAKRRSKLLILDRAGYNILRKSGNSVAYAIERLALAQLGRRISKMEERLMQAVPSAPSPYSKPNAPQSILSKLKSVFQQETPSSQPIELDKLQVLEQSNIFVDIDRTHLPTIALMMSGHAIRKGTYLVEQGSPGRHGYILASGEVDVFAPTGHHDKQGNNLAVPSAFLQVGDIFGLSAMIDGRTHLASCVAKTDCTVLAITRNRWNQLVAQNSPEASSLRYSVIRSLGNQLLDVTNLFVDAKYEARTMSFDHVSTWTSAIARLEHSSSPDE